MREHLSSQLSNLFGTIASGAIGVGLVHWFYINFFYPVPIQDIGANLSIGEFILFFGASYLSGHLLQSLSIKSIQTWISEQLEELLRKSYTPDFKQEIERYAKRIFGSPKIYQAGAIQGNVNEAIAKEKAIYYLCDSLVAQQRNLEKEVFYTTLTLYRGIRNGILLGIFVSGSIVTKHLYLLYISFVNLLSYQNSLDVLPQIELYKFEDTQFVYGAIFFILFLVFLYLWNSRCKTFICDYIDWVYMEFYVWYKLAGSRLNHSLPLNRLEATGQDPVYASTRFRRDD